MAAAISFPTTTPNFSLPLLFAGQAQKEFFVNQSLSVIDALLQHSVVASLNTPPVEPSDGEKYRVLSPATGAWADQENKIAVQVADTWHFLDPTSGMSFFDQDAGAFISYNSGWQTPVEPAVPVGGTNVDAEAREALSEILEVLRQVGVFANPA